MEQRIITNIPHTLKEGVVFSISPQTKQNKVIKAKSSNKPLFEENIVKLVKGERVFEIQRQHPIVLFAPIIAILMLAILAFLPYSLPFFQTVIEIPTIILVEFSLVIVCLTLTFVTYSFMFWYFQFYVITNKSLFHRNFFRIGGYYSEEVFLETSPERNIIREASNFFYSLFNIDDVIVTFQRPGIEKFTFKAPENAQRIEDSLEEIVLLRKDKSRV